MSSEAPATLKAEDCVVFVKMPPGNTAVKRDRLPLGQCGVILHVHDADLDPDRRMYKVTFGDRFGTYWLGKESLEPINDKPAQKVLLGETPLAANAGVPTHVEVLMPAQAVRELATLAIDIALGCPLDRPSQPGYYTYVNRDTVREIRRVLETAGIPWKLQHKELRK